uniref:Ribosomal protein L32 n=1 Tax=Panagrolaimus superbus TaxID=310955 RepID=A0A914Y9V4_9BILA
MTSSWLQKKQNILNDFRIVFGVPKFRTPKPRIMKRKFGYTRLLRPEENLVTCKCGFSHHVSTICSACYEKVRRVTNLIKQEMMKYNPYLGERQDKSFFVKYENEKDAEATSEPPPSNAKIIKVKAERDSWFTSRFSENDKDK